MTTWRTNDLALDALQTQGYVGEEGPPWNILEDTFAAALRDVFMTHAVPASDDEWLVKLGQITEVGLSDDKLIDAILPGFRDRVTLAEDETELLTEDPKDHPDLVEKHEALTAVRALVWGQYCKTNYNGRVQSLLLEKHWLLCEEKVPIVKGRAQHHRVKFITDDVEVMDRTFFEPRGAKIVKVSGNVKDDCVAVASVFEEAIPAMKRTLGKHVVTAVVDMLPVAAPDWKALNEAAGNAAQLGTGKK